MEKYNLNEKIEYLRKVGGICKAALSKSMDSLPLDVDTLKNMVNFFQQIEEDLVTLIMLKHSPGDGTMKDTFRLDTLNVQMGYVKSIIKNLTEMGAAASGAPKRDLERQARVWQEVEKNLVALKAWVSPLPPPTPGQEGAALSDSDLVSFGKYLLSETRRTSILMAHPDAISSLDEAEVLGEVYHADIENWRASV